MANKTGQHGTPRAGNARTPVRVMVIEDDPVSLEVVVGMIGQLPDLVLVGRTGDPEEGMEMLRTSEVDLLILDIGLPGMSGFELLEQIDQQPVVLITTGEAGHALKGFEVGVTDLLVKPFRFDRFMLAIGRGIDALEERQQANTDTEAPSTSLVIGVRSGRRMIRVDVRTIQYIEARGNNLRLHLDDRLLDASCTMKTMAAQLPANGFTRVHRSYIISDHIVVDLDHETLYTTMGEIPIGGTYQKEVYSRFKDLSSSDNEIE